MRLKISLFSLVTLLACCTSSVAQPPGIDGNRWTNAGGIALSQTQGFAQGDPMRLTWGFAREGTTIASFGTGPSGPSDLIARMDAIYGSGPGGADLTLRPWYNHYKGVFDRWSSISGLSYQYEANDDSVAYSSSASAATNGILNTRADVRIGGRNIDGNSGVLAFNFFPTVGDMVIDTNDNFFGTPGSSTNVIGLRNVVAHEHGHGIGMNHLLASDSSQLMEPFINTSFDGPQFHDILVAQRAYGDFNEKGAGNDISANATSLGAIAIATAVSVGNSARTLVVPANATDFVSIDDNTDTDVFSFSVAQSGNISVLLESLGFTYKAEPQSGGGADDDFNTRLRSDMTLELLGTNGSTVLASANATGLGGSESISGFLLNTAGTYFVRVTGVDNADAISLDTQFYGLTLNFSAVPEPATAALFAVVGMAFLTIRRRRS